MAKSSAVPVSVSALVVYINVAMYGVLRTSRTSNCFGALAYCSGDDSIGAESSSAYGKLQTVFSAIQTIGGLVSGVLIDTYGAKVVMVVSFAASAAVYGMTAAATSMPLLYASSCPALLQHGVLAARVWITNACIADQRATWLGYIGLAYSVGQVSGPIFGGLVGDSAGPRAPAYLAAWGSVASTLSLLFLLPGVAAKEKAADEEDGKTETSNRQRMADIFSFCMQRSVRELIGVKFLLGCVTGIQRTAMPLILSNNLQLSVVQVGYMVSYMGLIGFFVHGFLIGFLTKRFSDSAIVRFSCASLLASYCSLAFCTTVEQIAIIMLPLTVSSFMFDTINTAQLTKVVSQQNTGSVLAVDMSLSSVSGLMTPMTGTMVLQRYGIKGIGGTCGSLVAVVVMLMFVRGVGAGSPGDKKVS